MLLPLSPPALEFSTENPMKISLGRFLTFTMILLSSLTAFAGSFAALYSFCSVTGCTDGSQSVAGLIQDTAGNLYGTTSDGGANTGANSGKGGGTVFKLAPPAQPGGEWTETVLYSFCSAKNCTDGESPLAGLIQDTAGNLYGTTEYGGANTGAFGGQGGGTIFKLAPPAQPAGAWTETVLYSFCSVGAPYCTDGEFPLAGLIQDAAGNLYGTTEYFGGAVGEPGSGTVFKLALPAQPGGEWTETVLYSFCVLGGTSCLDGGGPSAGLIQDATGNFYSTTVGGGAGGGGTVFKLAPPARPGGEWTETVLYSFCSAANCVDGKWPLAGLIQDIAGNLYSTTEEGGASINYGTVFKLAPPAEPGGAWTETVLYSFCSLTGCTDGAESSAGLIRDVVGNLYGTTQYGGSKTDGAVFKLALPTHPGGQWTETVLYSFCPVTGCADGENPFVGLMKDAAGNLYGTTKNGDPHGGGTVFELAGAAQKANAALGQQVDYFDEGKADYTVWRPSDGIWFSSDSSGHEETKSWGASTDVPIIGDYDGDGKTDFAVFRPSTGTWFIIYSSNGTEATKAWGVPGDIPVPGDYDGDGKTDFAIFRPSNATWYIIQSSNGKMVTQGWGAKGDIPVPGDYDGDGKTDIAIFRPSIGTWFVLQSSNGKEVVKGWGTTGDIPVPGDYDGDGKTDLAVFRPSIGGWFVLQSSNGQELTKGWGTKGDVPVARDYDGDGKTDFAVWRPSDGTWYVIYSSNGDIVTKPWGASTDIPINKPVGQ